MLAEAMCGSGIRADPYAVENGSLARLYWVRVIETVACRQADVGQQTKLLHPFGGVPAFHGCW
jgi:hypothetical protein